MNLIEIHGDTGEGHGSLLLSPDLPFFPCVSADASQVSFFFGVEIV